MVKKVLKLKNLGMYCISRSINVYIAWQMHDRMHQSWEPKGKIILCWTIRCLLCLYKPSANRDKDIVFFEEVHPICEWRSSRIPFLGTKNIIWN